jgi:hypothetical protein
MVELLYAKTFIPLITRACRAKSNSPSARHCLQDDCLSKERHGVWRKFAPSAGSLRISSLFLFLVRSRPCRFGSIVWGQKMAQVVGAQVPGITRKGAAYPREVTKVGSVRAPSVGQHVWDGFLVRTGNAIESPASTSENIVSSSFLWICCPALSGNKLVVSLSSPTSRATQPVSSL